MPAHTDTYARFFLHPQVQNDPTGRMEKEKLTHKDVLYVEVFVKGSKNISSSRVATEEDKANYPKSWKAFQNNSPEGLDGFPISCLAVGPSQVMDLNALGFFTVEELAEASDAVIANVKGGQLLQKKAKAYIKMQADIAAEVAAEDEENKKPGPKTGKQKREPGVKTGTA
jgi:hypothetical protein